MSRLSTGSMSYRHVVFPELPRSVGRALNLTPPTGRENPPLTDDLSGEEYQCLRRLFEAVGLRVDDYRAETMKRRVPACLRALRADSPRKVLALIDRNPRLIEVALAATVIGVTGFFRDATVWAAMEELVLPRLLARAAPRVWSAGCSDGSELYSTAILFAERGALERASLLGTDCRHEALARARDGCYDAAAVRNVPDGARLRYFRAEAEGLRIDSRLRNAAQWRHGSVLTTPEPGGWDLILCRNLAIYLQPAAAERLWMILERSLRPGGFLILGKAERPHGAAGLRAVAPCIYRRDRS